MGRGKDLKPRKTKTNKYYIKNGIVYMTASNNQNIEFMFDEEDLDKVKPFLWRYTPQGYITTKVNPNNGRKNWRLHHCILGFVYGGGLEVDHADRNRLNNRKNNLRVVPHEVNNQNCKLRINSHKSGFIGVNWNKDKQKWVATIYKGKRYYYGSYIDKVDAVKARLRAEKELFEKGFEPQRHLFKEYDIDD